MAYFCFHLWFVRMLQITIINIHPVGLSMSVSFEVTCHQCQVNVVPTNPIERRDVRIAELKKTVADMPALQEAIIKTKAELSIAKRSAHAAKSRVKFARQVTEERLRSVCQLLDSKMITVKCLSLL